MESLTLRSSENTSKSGRWRIWPEKHARLVFGLGRGEKRREKREESERVCVLIWLYFLVLSEVWCWEVKLRARWRDGDLGPTPLENSTLDAGPLHKP